MSSFFLRANLDPLSWGIFGFADQNLPFVQRMWPLAVATPFTVRCTGEGGICSKIEGQDQNVFLDWAF